MSDHWIEFHGGHELRGILRHLGPVSGGDILVFRGLEDEATRSECADAVMHYYVGIARARIEATNTAVEVPAEQVVPLLVFLPDDASLEHLNERDMLTAGWKRVEP